MADFNAGAVFIGFKTQTDQLAQGFTQATKIVQSFGNTVVATAKQVSAGAQTMSSSLANVTEIFTGASIAGESKTEQAFTRQFILLKDLSRNVNKAGVDVQRGGRLINEGLNEGFTKSEAKHAAKMANLVGRLISVQFAISQLADGAGRDGGRLESSIGAVSKGFSIFALTLSLMPNKAGLVIGAVAGVGAAIAGLIGPTEKEKQAAEKLKAELEGIAEALANIEKRGLQSGLRQSLEQRFPLAEPSAEQAQQNASLEERNRLLEKYLVLKERQRQLDVETKQLFKERAEGLGNNLFNDRNRDLFARRQQNEKEIGETVKAFETITTNAKEFVATLDQASRRDGLIKGIKDNLVQLDVALAANQENLKKGLVEPIEAANTETSLLLQKAKAVTDFNAAMASIPEHLRKTVTLPDPTAAAVAALDLQRRRGAVDQLANSFATSIGGAIQEGILSGASALETLANVGKNLFNNMVTQAVDKLQVGLTAAFKAAAGEGGEILGTVLTGVIGVVGGIFSKKKGVQGQSFSAAQTIIDSSQAVRGVVSGPQNVAIAAVGESLKRALVGVEARLDVVIQVLNDIRRRGGTANATAPDVAIAGTVTQ